MAVWSAHTAPAVIDVPAAWGPISPRRRGRDPLLLPPEGFAEQQEGKQCREHGQREPEQRPPLVLDLCDDRQRERSERRQQPAEQRDHAEESDPVVLGCAGASDGIRDGEYRERRRDRDYDGSRKSDCPPGQTAMRLSGPHRKGSVPRNGSDCHRSPLPYPVWPAREPAMGFVPNIPFQYKV